MNKCGECKHFNGDFKICCEFKFALCYNFTTACASFLAKESDDTDEQSI